LRRGGSIGWSLQAPTCERKCASAEKLLDRRMMREHFTIGGISVLVAMASEWAMAGYYDYWDDLRPLV